MRRVSSHLKCLAPYRFGRHVSVPVESSLVMRVNRKSYQSATFIVTLGEKAENKPLENREVVHLVSNIKTGFRAGICPLH